MLHVRHSTLFRPGVSIPVTRVGVFMVYEWDERRAQRAYIMKILAAWMAAIVVAGLPVMMALNAMTL